MMDPTQRGDEVAAVMRDYYEANKPLHWWQKRRRYESECADDLMIGLLNVALFEWQKRAPETDYSGIVKEGIDRAADRG